MGFFKRTILTTLIFVAYAQLFPAQLMVSSFGVALIGALVLGVLNGIIKPILSFLSFPLTIITFGLFAIVINALMLSMMTWFVPGIVFSSFGSTLLLAIVISLVSAIFGDGRDSR